ncbi:MAG: hypothetical protein ACK4RM_08005 [Flavobacterium sp.]
MNYSKILFTTAMIAVLTSCSTTKNTTFKQNLSPLTAENVPLKNGKHTDEELLRWSHLDLIKDTIPGMSVDRAYETLLKNKKAQKVIVAVIDSGTDIQHEDLKGQIWTNTKEIPDNGIDDDGNGYVDDIHGWNFLGEATHENLEMTRILKKEDDGSETYAKAKKAFDKKKREALQNKMQVDFIVKADNALKEHF